MSELTNKWAPDAAELKKNEELKKRLAATYRKKAMELDPPKLLTGTNKTEAEKEFENEIDAAIKIDSALIPPESTAEQLAIVASFSGLSSGVESFAEATQYMRPFSGKKWKPENSLLPDVRLAAIFGETLGAAQKDIQKLQAAQYLAKQGLFLKKMTDGDRELESDEQWSGAVIEPRGLGNIKKEFKLMQVAAQTLAEQAEQQGEYKYALSFSLSFLKMGMSRIKSFFRH